VKRRNMKYNIVNIIHFIREVDPRQPDCDLLEPVINQIRLAKEYDLKTTFLIQYDAMINPRYSELLLREKNAKIEIGVWMEIVKPLVEKAGLKWRGREGFSWDWHANVGFSIGYSPVERERLADIFMEDFKSTFGEYPASVGSWFIDAHTLAYLANTYGIKASCMCKDQWGTDGYNLWGGYYNQAFYPSRKNMFSPAQNRDQQIDLPVFRMLGSDPIYQYDAGLSAEGLYEPASNQPVYTLEPVYPMCGGNPEWVRWFFDENFTRESLSFGYTQVGQENSFGWELMKQGLESQIKLVSEKEAKGEIQVQTLKESGEWFRSQYKVTPASAIIAQKDWKKQGHGSIWYCNRYYRINMFYEKDRLWIRDIYRFDEEYTERYLTEKCESTQAVYDNLPIIDGYRWSGGNVRAGIYPVFIMEDGTMVPMTGTLPKVSVEGQRLNIEWKLNTGKTLHIECGTQGITLTYISDGQEQAWAVCMCWDTEKDVPVTKIEEKAVTYNYQGYSYHLGAEAGFFTGISEKKGIMIYSEKGKIALNIHE
jgi:hypothetical protein